MLRWRINEETDRRENFLSKVKWQVARTIRSRHQAFCHSFRSLYLPCGQAVSFTERSSESSLPLPERDQTEKPKVCLASTPLYQNPRLLKGRRGGGDTLQMMQFWVARSLVATEIGEGEWVLVLGT